MKTYEVVDVKTNVLLPLVLGQWSVAWPGQFTSGERALGIHWIGGWVGPRVGLDDMEEWKFLPHRDSNSEPLVIQPIASCYNNCAISAHQAVYLMFSLMFYIRECYWIKSITLHPPQCLVFGKAYHIWINNIPTYFSKVIILILLEAPRIV
jgi:hypothetical protein